MPYLWIAIGSALGGMARYWCSAAVASRIDSVLPWGTIFVNILGSLLIGIAFGVLDTNARWQLANATREIINQFFMIGVLGGFTTFSSFSLQTLSLMRAGQWTEAMLNVAISVALCLIAVSLGFWLATR